MSSLLPLLLSLVLAGPGASEEPAHAFAAIDGHYQSIRVTLLQDSTKQVRENAAAIAKTAEALQAGLSAGKAGVAEGDLAAVKKLLPEVIARAKTLAAAEEIGPQREALKKLTQPLVRWHEKVAGAKPRLAYCSMERGAWFQPDGELGNPYGGQRMPRCGTFVTK